MHRVVLFFSICIGYLASFEYRDDGPDLDDSLTTPQIIRRHGYPSEAHVVITEDGYLLTLHRIPYGKKDRHTKRKAVFLQHGLLSSSADWIITGPEQSLAYLLADKGYDVWMGNSRGNTYSRAHVSLLEDNPEFWNFTWHEMAVYDLPAAVDYVLGKVKQKTLFYVGHSMGTTMFFAMASTKPNYGAKVKAMFALAPVAYMTHIKSPIRLLAPWANDLQFLVRYLGHGEFLPNNKIMRLMSRYGCELATWEKKICTNAIFVLVGFDKTQFNMTLLPLIMSHSPAGVSTKTMVHYAQEINSDGKFQEYDYGTAGNLKQYGTVNPPQYNISLIETPILLYYADNDWLSNEIDVDRLWKEVKRKIGKFLVQYQGFNHIDFLWGKDARTLVYNKIVDVMKNL